MASEGITVGSSFRCLLATLNCFLPGYLLHPHSRSVPCAERGSLRIAAGGPGRVSWNTSKVISFRKPMLVSVLSATRPRPTSPSAWGSTAARCRPVWSAPPSGITTSSESPWTTRFFCRATRLRSESVSFWYHPAPKLTVNIYCFPFGMRFSRAEYTLCHPCSV